MIKITKICTDEQCTGCAACFNACKYKAIKMNYDEEGFLRPKIEKDHCVGCGLCQRVCPVNNPAGRKDAPLSIYSGWSKNEEIRLSSASGGAFTELATYFIEHQHGVVFGVAMNDKLEACHISIENLEGLLKLQGSKYIQSIISDSYCRAEHYLKEGRNVLFSGTPCQIAGLKNYLRKEYENLYTVDLICHGVPSKRLFDDYIKYLGEKLQHPVYDVKFRCKKSSWIFFNMAVNSHIEKNTHHFGYEYEGSYYSDPFIRGFLRDNALRLCCYQCQYTSTSRVADFTVADWWGYKAESKEDKDFEEKGVSLIFANSKKAETLIPYLNMCLKSQTLSAAKKTNLSLSKPYNKPESRSLFWEDYNRLSFNEITKIWLAPERLPISRYIYYKMQASLLRTIIIKLTGKCERFLKKIKIESPKIKTKECFK